jgi:hypothetical protein
MSLIRPPHAHRLTLLTLACMASMAATQAWSQAPEPSTPEQSIDITGPGRDNAVGSSDAASQGSVRSTLIKSRPVQRSAEVLEFVPGVVVTQHSGEGKANQYFLRGFNLDHGTDFATSVNGLPINMVSHAHGQGYTDLNFLIPELIGRIDYRKGPYLARDGNFASAGSADIRYRASLPAPFVQTTYGSYRHRRVLAAGSAEVGADTTVLAAVEGAGNDGPWTVPEALQRRNAVLSLATGPAAKRFTITGMAYDARWVATDQVPQRLIDAGTYQGRPFGRFDSLDTSTGGRSSRNSLSAEYSSEQAAQRTTASAYVSRYRLSLFSNFTYLSERPETGDQFSQQDKRTTSGGRLAHAVDHTLGGLPATSEVGFQWRHDQARVGLFDTARRVVVGTVRDDDVRESSAGAYAQTGVRFNPTWRAVAGLRVDQARVRVASLSQAENSARAQQTLASPKLSLIARPASETEVFMNLGSGFHSNDARGSTARLDARTLEPIERTPLLVRSKGAELGARFQQGSRMQTSVALWMLNFDSELVYVGDAGTTEAGLASKRRGLEVNHHWSPWPWLSLDADGAVSRGRFVDGGRVPNAVDTVASMGLTLKDLAGWSASLQTRYLGSGPLIEDNSVRSRPALTTNARVTRSLDAWLPKGSEFSLDVFNLANRKVADIQYFYASRVVGEAQSVDDRHVHPALPRSYRLTFKLSL